MTVQEAMQILQNAPIEDRIQIIEFLVQSLKQDISNQPTVSEKKLFEVRTFSLGTDIHVDREELYLERGL